MLPGAENEPMHKPSAEIPDAPAGRLQTHAEPAAGTCIRRGVCRVLFAFDVGFSIDLDEAQRRTSTEIHRGRFTHRRRAPYYFDYQPPPLRVIHSTDAVTVGSHRTDTTVEFVLYDFGAVVISFAIPLAAPFHELLSLSNQLYNHAGLAEQARLVLHTLLKPIEPAIRKLAVSDVAEDYCIYEIAEVTPAQDAAALLEANRELIARTLRAETGPLSPQEVEEALACRISFSPDDLAIIDWNAALLLDSGPDDVRSVLEFANVELLELRHLDDRLDRVLNHAYETMQRRWLGFSGGSGRADLGRIARLQMDSALLFEGVNNTLKLLGDQYLARVYRLASQRFHLQDWDTSILRKLQTIESIYEKLADRHSNRRMEVLEWIIIVLIALSIALPLVPGFGGK